MPLFRVVAFVSADDAPIIEQAYIAALRKAGIQLTNLTDGGEGCLGVKKRISAAQREAISRSMLGVRMGAEKRAAISRGMKGYVKTEQHRLALSKANKGVRRSQATKIAIATAKRRSSSLTEEAVMEIRTRRANGEKGVALAREYNVSQVTVCNIHKGRIWKELHQKLEG